MRLKRIVVMISGSGSNLQSIINAVNVGEINAKISGVISDKEDVFGLKRAVKENIPFKVVSKKKSNSIDKFNTENLLAIEEYKPDLIVLAGYLSIIDEKIISKYRNKIINIHPSLIPSFCGKGYYGEKVHEGVIDYGTKLSGATTHFVDEGADTGPVIMQKSIHVKDDDNAESLAKRVLKIEHEILVKTVKCYCENRIKVIGRKVRIS